MIFFSFRLLQTKLKTVKTAKNERFTTIKILLL